MTPHEKQYDALARWLGLEAVKALVPFNAEQIRAALATGDEHLNTLALAVWDSRHKKPEPERCRCCGQQMSRKADTPAPQTGVWELYVAAATRDRAQGYDRRVPGGWSLSNTVCVLKHVAKYYVAGAP